MIGVAVRDDCAINGAVRIDMEAARRTVEPILARAEPGPRSGRAYSRAGAVEVRGCDASRM